MKIALFCNGMRGLSVQEAIKKDHFVDVYTDRDVNSAEFVEYVKGHGYDLFIVAGYSRIFKKDILDVPRLGTWNCHAGPVPEYRGGSPLNWQIIDGEEWIGITVLQMDEGIDTGPVLKTAHFPLGSTETIKDAHDKANALFPEMILYLLGRGIYIQPEPQPESDAYKPQRNDEMGEIGVLWGAQRVHNFVRALTHPYPGAYIKDGHGRKLRIWSTSTD